VQARVVVDTHLPHTRGSSWKQLSARRRKDATRARPCGASSAAERCALSWPCLLRLFVPSWIRDSRSCSSGQGTASRADFMVGGANAAECHSGSFKARTWVRRAGWSSISTIPHPAPRSPGRPPAWQVQSAADRFLVLGHRDPGRGRNPPPPWRPGPGLM